MSQYQRVATLLAMSPEGTTNQMPVQCCSEQCLAVHLLRYENTVSKGTASLNAQKAAWA